MKRKNEEITDAQTSNDGLSNKKPATTATTVHSDFQPGLFDAETVAQHAEAYSKSGPYKHAVVHGLIDDALLRAVRTEIKDHISFTPKETDIYKIHQSGDLANLDGLPAEALAQLPSLRQLRDALYSSAFRSWVSSVAGSGPLSGRKTDMAVNVYVPGCHLLCHDDVIGSRRVSYILYLNDPDKGWKPEWGGALRLYPTEEVAKGFKLPASDWSKSIPPAWNQLSFFAVQPGESFHDVEEVYRRAAGESEDDGGRVRMAISGWFHIPQEGEEGYEPGLEEKLAERSSLQQLQGNMDKYDQPQLEWHAITESESTKDEELAELTEEDLQFLLQFMTPNYLTPDTVEELNELFTDESILQLSNFLSKKFAPKLKEDLLSSEVETKYNFALSRPPHKHHYQYISATPTSAAEDKLQDAPFQRVLDVLLPSSAFQKWLALVTGAKINRSAIMARRFRAGKDYQLAQGYDGENPQLEFTLCVTPTSGWGGEEADEGDESAANGASKEQGSNGKPNAQDGVNDDDNIGGYELYMAGDEPEDEDDKSEKDAGGNAPGPASHTGAGDRRSSKKRSADPAIYRTAGDDEDDGILFSNAASWNTLSIVLRDRGTLKFVKYISRAAPGDRFDYTGCLDVELEDEDDEEEGDE